MTPERWQQVKEVFHAVVALEPSKRGAHLDSTAGDDEELRAEVQALLAADEQPTPLLEKPLSERLAPFLLGSRNPAEGSRETPAGTEGTTLGPYRLTREIGRGGTGTVYLAVRDDEVHQRVAVKVLQGRMVGEEALIRFRREQQILASLDHPGIARLLDAGTTDDGRPYLVMELIEGQPIDDYCDRRRLGVEERLRLFRAVCDAVAHAHQNLVVHRDLKPANILVTADGSPKLLDFGIAKLLNPELAHQALHTTRSTAPPMTPLYASPEQVRGEPVTTTTDVYSLGVLLYLLLTGRLPYEPTQRISEVERAICEDPPARPSSVVRRPGEGPGPDGGRRRLDPVEVAERRGERAGRLGLRLAGDLDAVVLHALHKEPTGRYGSVEALAADLGRHLSHRPVIARRGQPSYRAGKFIRRNRAMVALWALTLTFAGAMAAQTLRLGKALDEVRQERRSADRVAEFLVDFLGAVDPNRAKGQEVTAREVLDIGTRRVVTELSGQPEIQAELMATLGVVYQRLGLLDRSAPLLEGALEIRRRVYGDRHLEVADSLERLAFLRFAEERDEEAETLYGEALDLYRRQLGERHAKVAGALHGLAEVRFERGEIDAAEDLFRRALDLRLETLGPEHQEVAESFAELGTLLVDRRNPADGEQMLRRALAMQRKLLGDESTQTAVTLRDLGMALYRQQNFAEAEPLLRRALRMQRDLLGENRTEVATTLNGLALVLMNQGDPAAALPMFESVLATYGRLVGEEHPWCVTTLRNISRALRELERLSDAERAARAAFELGQSLWPEGHPTAAWAAADIGSILGLQGKSEDAEAWLRRSSSILRRVLPEHDWRIAHIDQMLATCLERLGRLEEAERLFQSSLEALERELGAEHVRTESVRQRLQELRSSTNRISPIANEAPRVSATPR